MYNKFILFHVIFLLCIFQLHFSSNTFSSKYFRVSPQMICFLLCYLEDLAPSCILLIGFILEQHTLYGMPKWCLPKEFTLFSLTFQSGGIHKEECRASLYVQERCIFLEIRKQIHGKSILNVINSSKKLT